MLSFYVIHLLVATARFGSAVLTNKATIADLLFDSTTQSQEQAWDLQTKNTNIGDPERSHVLQERASTSVGSTSYTLVDDHLFQWIFGNATRSVNISVSTCVLLTDIAGPYQFNDGTMSYNATMLDILKDLGFGSSSDAHARYANRTLSNAQSAYDEIQAFLIEDILVTDNTPSHAKPGIQGRALSDFRSEGRVLALVMKTIVGAILGLGMARLGAGPEVTHGQLAAGAISSGALVAIVSIVDIIREEGGIAKIEPPWMQRLAIWIANVFISLTRKLVGSAREAPAHGERRYTQSEMDDYLERLQRLDMLSAWDPTSTPGTSSSIQGFVCDDSPV